jgi:uncharacterized membrane protein (DUF106 family)
MNLNTPNRLLLDGQTTTTTAVVLNKKPLNPLVIIIVVGVVIFFFSFDTSKASAIVNDQKIKEYNAEIQSIEKAQKEAALEKEIIAKQVELLKIKNTK